MLKKNKDTITIYCDNMLCDNIEDIQIKDMVEFKQVVKEFGWHLRKRGRCICMDCWDQGIR